MAAREHTIEVLSSYALAPTAPAIVMVTHHIEEIPSGTTHALILKDGIAAVSGPIHEVITSEHMSAVFDLPMEVRHEGSRFFARAL
jgi:iron complex transport system ATP-binding protein